MSAEGKLGSAKLRTIEEVVGEPLLMAFALDHRTVEAVTPEDEHLRVDRQTGEVERLLEPTHWNTCPGIAPTRHDVWPVVTMTMEEIREKYGEEGWHQPADMVVFDDPPCRPLTPAEQAWWDEEIRQRYTPS